MQIRVSFFAFFFLVSIVDTAHAMQEPEEEKTLPKTISTTHNVIAINYNIEDRKTTSMYLPLLISSNKPNGKVENTALSQKEEDLRTKVIDAISSSLASYNGLLKSLEQDVEIKVKKKKKKTEAILSSSPPKKGDNRSGFLLSSSSLALEWKSSNLEGDKGKTHASYEENIPHHLSHAIERYHALNDPQKIKYLSKSQRSGLEQLGKALSDLEALYKQELKPTYTPLFTAEEEEADQGTLNGFRKEKKYNSKRTAIIE